MNSNVEVLTQFRPMFYIILGFLVLFLLLSLLPKRRESKINQFSVVMISSTHLILASVLLIMENEFLDRFGLRGDAITFYLYVAILVISILNPIVFYIRNKRSRRTSYGFR